MSETAARINAAAVSIQLSGAASAPGARHVRAIEGEIARLAQELAGRPPAGRCLDLLTSFCQPIPRTVTVP